MMIRSDPQDGKIAWGSHKPALSFALLALVLLATVGLVAEMLFGVFIPPIILFLTITALGLRGLLSVYPHDTLGACNGITLVRAAMGCVLVGAIFAPAAAWAVFTVATLAFALDGIDGWLARRAHLSSAFGARFDMEIDALLGAVLALHLLAVGVAGPAIFVLGFTRYAFVMAGLIWPALRAQLPESLRRKTICVVQIAALIALVFPLTPTVLLTPIAYMAAAALLYSFAVDAVILVRHRA